MRRSPNGRPVKGGISQIKSTLVLWVPSMVTASRILLSPVIVYLFSQGYVWSAVAIFAFAIWTDWLDGVLARALRAQSDFGAFLDATSDKLLILPILFVAGSVAQPTLNFWLGASSMHAVWVLAAIEAALTVLRLPRLFSPGVNVHAGKMGKWKLFAEVIAVFEVMVLGSLEALPIAIGLGVLSLIEHLVHYRK